jgi:hypothetical protein
MTVTEPIPEGPPIRPIGSQIAGRRGTRKAPSAKALKRVLKSHGLKTFGKKATRRIRRLRRGGDEVVVNHNTGSNQGAHDIQEVRRSLRRTGSKLYGGTPKKRRNT